MNEYGENRNLNILHGFLSYIGAQVYGNQFYTAGTFTPAETIVSRISLGLEEDDGLT